MTRFHAALTVIFWASAYVAIRIGLKGYSPFELALFRYIIASMTMGILGPIVGIRIPNRTDLFYILLTGITGIGVYNMALNYAELTITAGEACFIINTAPLFTVLFSYAFLGETISLRFISGLFLSFIGVTLIAFQFDQSTTFKSGTLLVFIAAVAHAAFFVLQRPLLKKYSPIEVACYAIWCGTIFMLPFGTGFVEQIFSAGFSATAAVIYLGIFPAAVANLCWSSVLKKIPAARAASFLYAIPPVTLCLGFALIKEIPSSLCLAGGAMAIGGVAVANSSRRFPGLSAKSCLQKGGD